MSTPVLWIIAPGFAAGILYLLRKWERILVIAGVGISLFLSWLAWWLPFGEVAFLGPWAFRVSDTLWILGRRLVLTDAERPMLVLIYSVAAFWFGAARVSKTNRLFIPAGMAVAALLTASMAVDPFLYAALFIEMAALLCIPLLVPLHTPVRRGALRFLTFQTLGAPFILFTGWMAGKLEAEPNQINLILSSAVLAAIGFAFLMAVFPFHTWMPMLSEETHPYTAAFVFFMLPGVIALFGVKFLDSNPWLSSFPEAARMLRLVGAFMVTAGGIWAAFQRHVGRMLAYAVMVETGLTLLMIQNHWQATIFLADNAPLGIFLFPLFIARGLTLGTWALALSIFYQNAPGLEFMQIRGAGRRFPIATAAIILAQFSLAGFPLLVGFPIRLYIIDSLVPVEPIAVLWILLGMGGLLLGGLRTLAVLVIGEDNLPWTIEESRQVRFLLLTGMAVMILTGILPLI